METANGLKERPASERYPKAVKKGEKAPLSPPTALAERLAVELRRTKRDRVIVKQVGSMNFRVNWFVPTDELATGTNAVVQWRIDQSKFLSVTENGKALVIVDKTVSRQ